MGGDLPAWLAEVWEDWRRGHRSGYWLLNWHRGDVVELEEQVKRFPKKPSGGAPRCSACSAEMRARDGGTMWVCACGQKRTLAQVSEGE